MKVLVTGATGFVGRNLLDVLVALRPVLEIVCLVRDPEKGKALEALNPAIQIHHGDLLQPESLTTLPRDVDVIFHLAALVGLKNGEVFYEVNTTGTQNLLNALDRQSQLQRLVYVSSIAAVDRPTSAKPPYAPLTENSPLHPRTDYGRSKLQAEQAIVESGIPYTILRPAYIYGPYPRLGSSIHRVFQDVWLDNPYTKFPFTGHASAVYAPDLAELLWKASQAPQCRNQTYFAAAPQPVAVQYFFQLLHQLLRKSYRPYPIPKFLRPWLKAAMIREGLDPLLAEILFHDYFVCDSGKLYQHIPFQPYYGFEASVAQTLQWYRTHGLLTAS